MVVEHLSDYMPVVVIPLIKTCLGTIVMAKIQHNMPNTLDTQEFAYIPNISIEEILAAIQIALFHLHLIILSSKLTHKQYNLGWRSIVCRWMLDVLKVISSQLD